jgi:hypothetical protein
MIINEATTLSYYDFATDGVIEVYAPLTIKGCFTAPPVQTFEVYEGGSVDLSGCLIREAYLEWFGGIPDDPTKDCGKALRELQLAICPTVAHRDGLDVTGVKVPLCRGTYHFATQPKIFRPLWIEGAVASIYNISTRWKIANGVAGPVFLSHRQTEHLGGAHGSRLENVAIIAESNTAEVDGLTICVVMDVRGCWINGFGGNGVRIDGDTATVSGKNCSLTILERVRSTNNKGSGFFIHGGDANLIEINRCESSYNGKWGYCDRGFLGNGYWFSHASFNGRCNTPENKRYGAYCIGLGENDDFTGARPNLTTCIGIYSEGADPIEGPSRFSGNTVIINPNLSAGINAQMSGQLFGSQATRMTFMAPPNMRADFSPIMLRARAGQTQAIIQLSDAAGKVVYQLKPDGSDGSLKAAAFEPYRLQIEALTAQLTEIQQKIAEMMSQPPPEEPVGV